jgi:hypothetical protein
VHPRAKNYLIILLAFSTVTAGVIAWREARHLKDLQAALLAANTAPVVHKAVSKPDHPVAVAPTEAKPADDSTEPADAATPPARQQRNNRPNIAALMANPEFAKAWNIERRAQLDNRYAALFKELNLSPSQLDGFKNLLVERESAAMDVYAAARDQGLDPRTDRDAINKLIASAQADADQSIKAALGDTAYQQYQSYQGTQAQRAVVSQLDQRLSYSATPLTSAQSDFLVQVLSSPAPTADGAAAPSASGRGGFGGGRGGSVPITDAVIQQAQSVLTPDQVSALKELQAQQQAQQKVGEMFRAARSNN